MVKNITFIGGVPKTFTLEELTLSNIVFGTSESSYMLGYESGAPCVYTPAPLPTSPPPPTTGNYTFFDWLALLIILIIGCYIYSISNIK
jgi:hypothetical protein